MKINMKESAILALPVTAAVYIVSYLFNLLNIGAIENLFASVPATTVITGTIGQKVLGFIGGVIPFGFDFPTIAVTYVSALVAILIGSYLISQFKLPTIKKFFGLDSGAGKITSILLYGAIPVYVVLVGFALPGAMTIVGVVIHTTLVAFVTGWVAKFLKLKI